jgi:hypothetical protein
MSVVQIYAVALLSCVFHVANSPGITRLQSSLPLPGKKRAYSGHLAPKMKLPQLGSNLGIEV